MKKIPNFYIITYAFCESTFDIQILPRAGKILLNIDDFDIISYKVNCVLCSAEWSNKRNSKIENVLWIDLGERLNSA